MANDALCWMSAFDLAAAIARKKVSPLEVVDAVLDRIDRLKHLNAYCLVDRDGARRAARAAERALAGRRPTLGPLHGVPFSVKDLVATKGVRTTFGTPLYRDNVPELRLVTSGLAWGDIVPRGPVPLVQKRGPGQPRRKAPPASQ
jgi:aspartyl-tRNA(Asn)/glutamyl-tRNA(Gln) amidotransferase subunit A